MDESLQSPSKLYRILRAIKYLLKGWFWKVANKILLPFIRGQNVGKNSYIDPSVHVLGWRNVKIGDNALIGQDVWINVNHREKKETSVMISNMALYQGAAFGVVLLDCHWREANLVSGRK